MGRKVFWGVFSLLVLYACLAMSNFSSSTGIEEELGAMGGYSMPLAPYTREVENFFNAEGHWPTADEVVLSDPPADGMVHSVELEPNGMLVLHLRRRVWLQRVQIKVAVLLTTHEHGNHWACVNVRPASMARVVYRQCGHSSLADVEDERAKVIAARKSVCGEASEGRARWLGRDCKP